MRRVFTILFLLLSTFVFSQTQSNMYLSGSFTNWDQNWSRGDFVSLNTKTTWYNPNGGDGSINFTSGKYYTFTFRDVGNSTNSDGFVMETSNQPVSIPSVSDNYTTPGTDVTVNITLSGTKSPEENIFVRYTTDGWVTDKFVLASGSGTSYTAVIPGTDVLGTSDNNYYVLSTTLDQATMESLNTDVDLATINFNNNGGGNFPLPVELISFSATIFNNTVKLKWQTATEVNNYGFYVERINKNKNSDWQTLGFVKGHGNSNSPRQYTFVDNTANNGNYSYRLKQVDVDGSFEYSPVVEVFVGAPDKFELSQNYPNPFNPATIIKYSIPAVAVGDENFRPVQLKVYNVLGREIITLVNKEQSPGTYTVTFNAENFPSGLYFYKLTAGSFSQTKKMLLLK